LLRFGAKAMVPGLPEVHRALGVAHELPMHILRATGSLACIARDNKRHGGTLQGQRP